MLLKKEQQGMSAIGMMLVMILAGLVLIFIVKLAPIYLEGYEMDAVLEGLKADKTLMSKPVPEIRKSIRKRMSINAIDTPNVNDIEIIKTPDNIEIIADYDVETSFIGNIFIVVRYNKQVVLN